MMQTQLNISATLTEDDIKRACKLLVENEYPTMEVKSVDLHPTAGYSDFREYSPASCTATVRMEPRAEKKATKAPNNLLHDIPTVGFAR